jgi:hypothetical protein
VRELDRGNLWYLESVDDVDGDGRVYMLELIVVVVVVDGRNERRQRFCRTSPNRTPNSQQRCDEYNAKPMNTNKRSREISRVNFERRGPDN